MNPEIAAPARILSQFILSKNSRQVLDLIEQIPPCSLLRLISKPQNKSAESLNNEDQLLNGLMTVDQGGQRAPDLLKEEVGFRPTDSVQLFQEKTMHEKFKSCIDACYACAAACDHCAVSCLQEQDVKKMARCIALDIDCAQICRMAAAYMARGSEFAKSICQLCADVCQSCGDECAKHQMGHCQDCAQACHRCADECRRMAAAA